MQKLNSQHNQGLDSFYAQEYYSHCSEICVVQVIERHEAQPGLE